MFMSSRILILTNRVPYPLRDGGALAMDAMIRGYHDVGWQVHLLAMNTSRHCVPQEILQGLYTKIAGFHTVDIDNDVHIWGIIKNLLFSYEPEHAARFRSQAYAVALAKLLRDVEPQVIQLESPFLASYLPVVRAEAAGAIVVYRMHNVEGQIWSRLAAESSGLKRLYLEVLARRVKRYERRLWEQVDLILPISEQDAAAISAANVLTPTVQAPFGITVEEKQPLPPGPFKVYHIGAMDWLPNQEAISWFLKEAWPELHAASPDITFHFAGRGMPLTFYENLPPGAFCAGEVEDAAAFIRDKHLLVVPLRSGSGIRIKILESMAQGKLVISTDIGMQGINAQDNLHYLEANTAYMFAQTISWAHKHPREAANIVRLAYELVRERYDAHQVIKRVTAKLEQMLNNVR